MIKNKVNNFTLKLTVLNNKIYLQNLSSEFITDLANSLAYETSEYNYITKKYTNSRKTMLPRDFKTCSYGFKDDVINVGLSHDINIEYDVLEGINLDLSIAKSPYELTKWQKSFVATASKENNLTIISPTGSGKSVLIFLLAQSYFKQRSGKILVTTDTNSLINQTKEDFLKWGFSEEDIGEFHGTVKEYNKRVTISTWQSIHAGYSNKNKSKEQVKAFENWLSEFDIFIADECHLYKSNHMKVLGTKMGHCRYKYGFTGTLDGSEYHTMVMRSLFGNIHKLTTLNEMRHHNFIPRILIKPILLKWNDVRENGYKLDYKKERALIQNSDKRMLLIARLILSIKTEFNIIIFTNFNKQLDILYKHLSNLNKDKKIITINGSNKKDKDVNIKMLADDKNIIAIANYKMIQTGINANKIEVGVFIDAGKSKIKTKQPIGRLLRKCDSIKVDKKIIDIYDDVNGRSSCYSMKHFEERVGYYLEDGHLIHNTNIIKTGDINE